MSGGLSTRDALKGGFTRCPMHRLSHAAMTALLLAAIITLATSAVASAHTRVELGSALLVVGWANEPVIVGERNALVIEATQDGQRCGTW